MGKKNRRKNKQQQYNSHNGYYQRPHWYDYDYEYDYLELGSFRFSQVKSKEIHAAAEKIFGKTYYISYTDFQKQVDLDIISTY